MKIDKRIDMYLLSESDDIDILADHLSNSMEFLDEKEFVSFLKKNTSLKPPVLKKIYNEYWKIPATDRGNPRFDFSKWVSKFIK
jgi:hypothetical protein